MGDTLSKNASAKCLSPFDFELFPIFVVDFLHKFELGVLKFVLQHLIQILYAIYSGLVTTLNEQYYSTAANPY